MGEFGGFQIAYRKGTVDEEVLGRDDIFFSDVPEYEPGPDHVILDIGAHIGSFCLLAASKVPQGKVYAVEACGETFNYLTINIALNHMQNVESSQIALAGSEGTTTLYYDEGNWGHSITKKLSSRGEEVSTKTLAGYMAENGIERCNFAKLNVEGAEFPILLNASAETLSRIDLMLIHYHVDLVNGFGLDDLLDHLHQSGFETRVPDRLNVRGEIIATRIGDPEGRREGQSA